MESGPSNCYSLELEVYLCFVLGIGRGLIVLSHCTVSDEPTKSCVCIVFFFIGRIYQFHPFHIVWKVITSEVWPVL